MFHVDPALPTASELHVHADQRLRVDECEGFRGACLALDARIWRDPLRLKEQTMARSRPADSGWPGISCSRSEGRTSIRREPRGIYRRAIDSRRHASMHRGHIDNGSRVVRARTGTDPDG